MTDTVIAGLLAGYGIAMPVGAMSVLIITLSSQVSLRLGTAAGLGVATADGLYALAAVLGGAAMTRLVTVAATPLSMLAAAALAVVALRGLVLGVRAHRAPVVDAPDDAGSGRPTGMYRSPLRMYLACVGLTMLNPVSLIYFGALVIGRQAGPALHGSAGATVGALVFVTAALLASTSWQMMLALGGAMLGKVMTSTRGRLVTNLAGNTVILVLAAHLAWAAAH